MRTALWIGVAGFFGSISRYAISGAVSRVDQVFPWGTFVVNTSGSFVLGLVVTLFARGVALHPDLRIAMTVGFLGAYTTFSTIALETLELAETQAWGWGILNIGASLTAGLAAVWLGTILGRVA